MHNAQHRQFVTISRTAAVRISN